MMKNITPKILRKSGKSLAEQIAQHIISEIKRDVYKSGDKLPSLRYLADQYAVSHETVKKAFTLLKEQGVIEVISNVGALVRINHRTEHVGSNQVIGVIIDTGLEKYANTLLMPLYDRYIELASNELSRNGYTQIAAYICFQEEEDKTNFYRIMEKVDGVLVVNLNNPNFLNCLINLGKPIVTVSPSIDTESLDSVCINYFKTYYNITKQIIKSGYKNPVLFDGPKNFDSTIERQSGFLRACREMGSPTLENRIIHSPHWGLGFYQETVGEWLKKSPEVDALISVNDNFAIGALKALQEAGIRVPQDIALVGGKNTPLCTVTTPELTSVNHFYERITYQGVKLLLENIHYSSTRTYPVSIRLLGELVYRSSLPKQVIDE